VWLDQSRQHLHGRRLAGAVRSKQAEHGTVFDNEGQTVERLHPLWIELDEALGLDPLLHHDVSLSWMTWKLLSYFPRKKSGV
jgi:hypothetical protein